MINQAKFAAARTAVLCAKLKRETLRSELFGKHLHDRKDWYTRADVKRTGVTQRAYNRACDRVFKLLLDSPRDWSVGVPSWWVAEQLLYADAVRPRSEQLSEVPPIAFGAREAIK